MRPISLDIDVADEDTDGLADGLTGAGPWDSTDFVTTTPTDSLAHKLNITSADNLSAITFTITGTDADGREQTEAITGPNATTVESTKYYATLTAVSVSSTVGANTFDIGWVDEVATKTIIISPYENSAAAIQVNQTGTMNWDVQVSLENPWSADHSDQEDIAWINDTNFSGKSADTINSLTVAGVFAFRFVTNSYDSGAEAQLYATFPR